MDLLYHPGHDEVPMSHDELDIGSGRVSRLCRRERSERASFDTSDEIGLSGPLARLQNVI